LRTYEFLHATFGEYLVARMTWQVTVDAAGRAHASQLPSGGVDDELLYALLSFVGLAVRRPTVDFLQVMAAKLSDEARARLGDLLIRLYQFAGFPRLGRAFENYQPELRSVSGRHAAYSSNLLLLTVIVRGTVRATELYGTSTKTVGKWHDQALLWQSQLLNEFYPMVEVLTCERTWHDGVRDVRLSLNRRLPPEPVNPLWTYGFSDGQGRVWAYTDDLALQRRVNLLAGSHTDLMAHALEPLYSALGRYAVTRLYAIAQPEFDQAKSLARMLTDVWLLGTDADADEPTRLAAYHRVADVCTIDPSMWPSDDGAEPDRLIAILLNAIKADRYVSTGTIVTVLNSVLRRVRPPSIGTLTELEACLRTVRTRLDLTETELQRLEELLPTQDTSDTLHGSPDGA
jgi:hypothetical protein